jgi:4-amino-4-deoxy-L-arabinose transferase-like glycosyltransferase
MEAGTIAERSAATELPAAGGADRRPLLVIGAVALCSRVIYVLAFMRGYRPNSDADSYFAIGRAVANGRGYVFTLPFSFVHATAIRPPLYPTLIAAAFRVFGQHVGVAQGVNVVVGSVSAVLAALIGARVSGVRAGWCAGLVVALYPPLIANDVTLLVESLALALVLALVLLLVDGRTAIAGLVLGLLVLDRASAQWLVAFVAAWVWWRFGWRHALRLIVIAVLVVTPWVIRNDVHVGGPVVVATNGFNLNAKYSNEATGVGFVDAYFDPRFSVLRANATSEVDLDARLRAKALHDLRSHPERLVRVVRSNLAQWFELRPASNDDPERLDGRNLHVRHWTLPLFYIVTIAGLFGLWRARRAAAVQLLGLCATYFTVVCLLSIAVPRLRSIFDGCVAVGAGLALAWLIDRRVEVFDQKPEARRLDVRRSAAVIVPLVVVLAAGALVWQAQTRRNARNAVSAAVARDGSAIDAILTQLDAGAAKREPPTLEQPDLARAQDLVDVLGSRAPQVPPSERARVVAALRAALVAVHEVDVVGLIGVAESLHPTQHQQSLIDRVRQRYETQARPADPTLEPWDAVASGRSFGRVRAALQALEANGV